MFVDDDNIENDVVEARNTVRVTNKIFSAVVIQEAADKLLEPITI
jgi:hypothetical protein